MTSSPLTALLRDARARTSPESRGLVVANRRRATGLRIEDVAELAAVSEYWYARFERGRARLSLKALNRVADALALEAAERREFFALALPELSETLDAEHAASRSARVPDGTALPTYGELCRSQYADVKQDHYALSPTASLFAMFDRPPGAYFEPPSADVVLQIVTRGFGGTATLDFGHGTFRANIWDGEFVVAPAGISCSYELEASFDILHLPLPFERFTRRTETGCDVERLHAQAWQDPVVVTLARSLFAEARSGSRDQALFIDSAASTIVARLAMLAGRVDDERRSLSATALASVFEILSSTLPVAQCTLDLLAAAAHMDACDMLPAFRRATGVTPDHYLTNVRIDRSRELLATTDLCIPDIARRVGFDDDERYERLFTTRTRISPAAFRAERRR